jgi:hypothetical protein
MVVTVEREYDTLACQVAIARKALATVHEYTDYLLAHAEEIREIKARRLADAVEGRP